MANDNNNKDLKPDRNNIDDPYRRNRARDSYKNVHFDGKRSSVDEYTGKKIYYSKNAAYSIAGRHYTTKTTSNVDHVVPRKVLVERYGDNLTIEQYKHIANMNANLALTNEHLNKSKNDLTNFQYCIKYIKDQRKEGQQIDVGMVSKMLYAQAVAEVNIAPVGAAYVVQNKVSKSLKKIPVPKNISAVGETIRLRSEDVQQSMVVCMASSISNIAAVTRGEKTADQAVKDVAVDMGMAAANSKGLDLLQNTIKEIAAKGDSSGLQKMTAAGLPLDEITAIINTGTDLVKLLAGQITAEECVCNLLVNGLGHIAAGVGALFAGPVGGVILSIVVTNVAGAICNKVLSIVNEIKSRYKYEKQRIDQFIRIAGDAVAEIERQRGILKHIIETEFNHWDGSFECGFDLIYQSIFDNDPDKTAFGIDTILSVFNAKCAFATIGEFNSFFDDPEAVLVL